MGSSTPEQEFRGTHQLLTQIEIVSRRVGVFTESYLWSAGYVLCALGSVALLWLSDVFIEDPGGTAVVGLLTAVAGSGLLIYVAAPVGGVFWAILGIIGAALGIAISLLGIALWLADGKPITVRLP